MGATPPGGLNLHWSWPAHLTSNTISSGDRSSASTSFANTRNPGSIAPDSILPTTDSERPALSDSRLADRPRALRHNRIAADSSEPDTSVDPAEQMGGEHMFRGDAAVPTEPDVVFPARFRPADVFALQIEPVVNPVRGG